MIRSILFGIVLSLVVIPQVEAASYHKLFGGRLSVRIPKGFKYSENPPNRDGVLFVRKGDGAKALAKVRQDDQIDNSFLDAWFSDNILEYVIVRLFQLRSTDITEVHYEESSDLLQIPAGASQRQVHDLLVSKLSKGRGKHNFSIFDEETGIGRWVNYEGAFIYVASRRIGDTLVVVEAINKVEAVASKGSTIPDNPESWPIEELWNIFKEAGNDKTAVRILQEARLTR